jgi:hypothetical protein
MLLTNIKNIAKSYKLKLAGTKQVLIERIEQFLKLSFYAAKIQHLVKKRYQRKQDACRILQKWTRHFLTSLTYKLRGPGFWNRKLCVNEYDFLTGDTVEEISSNQFFSFRDSKDSVIYGFDILSIHNLMQKTEQARRMLNPYNRNEIVVEIKSKLLRLLRLCRYLKIPVNTIIANPSSNVVKTLVQRVEDLFDTFDRLGNYTNMSWFMDLNANLLLKFLRELSDIWNYRSQISYQVKREICPPYGDPFRTYGYVTYWDPNAHTIESIRIIVVNIMESMVYKATTTDNKTLGIYYILCSLTLVSNDAASALPWLHQSVV